MPAPTSNAELIDLIQRSGVLDACRLEPYLQSLRERGSVPTEPQKLAGLMVRDGILTYFQAEQFLLGKYKRFTIGKYKVLERLGSGGMGQVFLCEHIQMGRRVAVKVLPAAKSTDPAALQRFYREARAGAVLDHPNLVRAHDIDRDDKLHFLVMEYIDGASFQELVKKIGPLDWVRACHYVYWSAVGLQYAHTVAGLIHRDVKPGNILVDRQGVIKILDMGLARFFRDTEDILTKKYDESTLGTADYLAPEQAVDSHEVDVRADIYSLGATFYYLLTGRPPFADGTIAQKLIWHQTKAPPPVSATRDDVPATVLAILDRMMAKSADARYQSPDEVVQALAPFVQTPIPPPAECELPRLSPAVAASAPSSVVKGRLSTPKAAPAGPRPSGSPPGFTGRAAPKSSPGTATVPATRPKSNPFSKLLAPAVQTAPQPVAPPDAYAKAAAVAGSRLPPRAAPMTRSRKILWSAVGALGGITLGAAAAAASGYFNFALR